MKGTKVGRHRHDRRVVKRKGGCCDNNIVSIKSTDLCAHCCTQFKLLGTSGIFHPLWSKEIMCHACVDRLARCTICERKASPWSTPIWKSGEVQKYDVLIHTMEGDGVLSPQSQLKRNFSKPPSYICGRCRSVGLITNRTQAIRELRFILESLYLFFGIHFSDCLLEQQKWGYEQSKKKFIAKRHKTRLCSSFSSQGELEEWLADMCIKVANTLPIDLFWGQEGDNRRGYCATTHHRGLPYIKCIKIKSHLSRPKFWAVMMHELMHAYFELCRGSWIEPSDGPSLEDHPERVDREEGLCQALTKIAMENILEEIKTSPDYVEPSRDQLQIGPPPIQLWELETKSFKEDFPYSNPPPINALAHWMSRGMEWYDQIYEESLQIIFILNKLSHAISNSPSFKRAVNLIGNRTIDLSHMTNMDQYHEAISKLIEEFIRTNFLPKK